MKSSAIAIAAIIALNCVAVAATAGKPNAAVKVVHVVPVANFAGCAPFRDPNTPACRKLLAATLANFTPRQIDQIQWAIATHQDLMGTGAMEGLLGRYAEFLTQYQQQVPTSRQQGHDEIVAR